MTTLLNVLLAILEVLLTTPSKAKTQKTNPATTANFAPIWTVGFDGEAVMEGDYRAMK